MAAQPPALARPPSMAAQIVSLRPARNMASLPSCRRWLLAWRERVRNVSARWRGRSYRQSLCRFSSRSWACGDWSHSKTSHQVPHRPQPDRLAAVIGLAVANADRLSPVGRFIAKLVQKGRGIRRPPFDELAVIAADGCELPFPQ